MARGLRGVADGILHRRMLRLWTRAAEEAATADFAELRAIRQRARQMRRRLDQALFAAEERLSRPLTAETIHRPLHSDWAWRPALWRGPVQPAGLAPVENRTAMGDEVTVFHDCAEPELALRQIRNLREEDLAPHGLSLEVFGFDGSFLSLVVDLPPEAAQGLRQRHVIRAALSVEAERPVGMSARLNVRHGPNTVQILRELPGPGPESRDVMAEFDLGYSPLNEKRVEKLWLDLIFQSPRMNRILLRDLTLTRRPRAEF